MNPGFYKKEEEDVGALGVVRGGMGGGMPSGYGAQGGSMGGYGGGYGGGRGMQVIFSLGKLHVYTQQTRVRSK